MRGEGWRIWFAVGLWLLLGSGCTDHRLSGGAGSESTNGLTVCLLNPEGQKSPGVSVQVAACSLLPKDSTWSFSLDTLSDSSALVNLEGLPDGEYQIVLRRQRLGLGFQVRIAGGVLTQIGDTMVTDSLIPQLYLDSLLQLAGQVLLPDGSSGAVISLYGTEIQITTDSKGNFTIDSMPMGKWSFQVMDAGSGEVLSENMMVLDSSSAGSPLQIATGIYRSDVGTWPTVIELSLDDSVYVRRHPDFEEKAPWLEPAPLLIWVNQNLISFFDLDSSGRGLLITDENGVKQPFTVRLWNSELQRALLWVRVTNLEPQGSGQILQLRMGKDDLPNLSDSVGVWQGFSDDLRQQLLTMLVVDDFSTPGRETEFPDAVPPILWHLGFDSLLSIYLSPADTTEIEQATENGEFQLLYQVALGGWIYAGMYVSSKPCDFSMLDSVTFDARGNGMVYFALENGLTEPITKAWISFNLTESMQHFVVEPKNFLSPGIGDDNVGWPSIQDSVTKIGFLGLNGNNLVLDNITLYGLHPLELLGAP